MIVKMKKVTLLCMESHRDATLEKLRDLGMVHVKDVQKPSGERLEETRAGCDRVKKALEIIPDVENTGGLAEKHGAPFEQQGWEVAEEAMKCFQKRSGLLEDLKKLRAEAGRIEMLGSFNPSDLNALEKKGLKIRIYSVLSKVPPAAPSSGKDAVLKILAVSKNTFYFAVIGKHEPDPDWTPFRLPDQSLDEINGRISEIDTELISIDTALKRLGREKAKVKRLFAGLSADLEFQTAKAGMGSSGQVAYLQGFCPVESVDLVRAAASEKGWGIVTEDPSDDDKVPTLIRHPRWVAPVKAVFDVIGILPGYREIDVSAVFLMFFSLFFAMLIGDAGYGLLFLALTLLARFKLKSAPAYPFTLMMILSIGTVLWGVLNGNYFGVSAPGPLSGVQTWLGDDNNLMGLCFLIGAVHLTIAHVWNAFKIINSLQALAQVGWIFITWTMMFLARYFVLDEPMTLPVLILGGVGLTLVALFMTPVRRLKAEIINHAMLGLSVINNFVDVVSYVRLFAVGMASVMVAQSFNDMAMQLGIEKIWTIPIIALILVAGHLLNIILCALGILVHAVRLNTLEFSNHIGLEWSGFKYDPFRKKIDKT